MKQEYSESAIIKLGGEQFLLGKLSDDELAPLLDGFPDVDHREDYEAAAGALLHYSISAQPLNCIGRDKKGIRRIAEKVHAMSSDDLTRACLQVLNYCNRENWTKLLSPSTTIH